MNYRREISHILEKVCLSGLALGMLALLSGCEEVNVAVDNILGRAATPAIAAGFSGSPTRMLLAKKREAGEVPLPAVEQGDLAVGAEARPEVSKPKTAVPGAPAPAAPLPQPATAQGKKRAPGTLSPGEEAAQAQKELQVKEVVVAIERDPFKPPTEILPSECPPSMPLCRFDRSQLKLRGVIQLTDGQFKGMVEDPDGRGYFVTTGMQIGGATVTQITNKGVTLFLHKTQQDVLMPLFVEARE